MKKHLNEDGTIKIFSNSIGSRFKDHVITANKDDQVWVKKVEAGNQDIDYHAQKVSEKRGHLNLIPIEFLLKKNERAEASGLVKRCAGSYRKPNGNVFSNSGKKDYNRLTRKREYWAIVGKYCGKPLQETPANGFKD